MAIPTSDFKATEQKERMLDILQLRTNPDELDQLRLCQAVTRNDCLAAFTVRGAGQIWPVAAWDEALAEERVNVRGWFPLLDKIADEFLLWWPKGGCFFVDRDKVTYRPAEDSPREVLFLLLETHWPVAIPRQADAMRPTPLGA